MTAVADDAVARGYEALASGDWGGARDSFREAVDAADSPEALDGLGRALWWLRDERGAIVQRERAYAGFRRDGEYARAARIALWLSREYGLVYDNAAAARGWIARAERLLRDVQPGAEQGWLDLTRSEGARDPPRPRHGLPDDRCQCPHMGYVVAGRVKFAFADGTEEVYEAGEAYYAPPGHLPYLYAGSEVVEFSPSAELRTTLEVVEQNMAAAGG